MNSGDPAKTLTQDQASIDLIKQNTANMIQNLMLQSKVEELSAKLEKQAPAPKGNGMMLVGIAILGLIIWKGKLLA